MSQLLGLHAFRKRHYRTLSLLCDDEPLSDAQLKAYHSRLQEYQTFLDAVSRLALCGNVCITEEAVTIGEHGLLTGESLNALQHAGAISVYNTLQQNNWEFPVAEEGEVAVIKAHNPIPDEFLDSEKPIRSDWPAVHISECFVEGERAKLHGSVRPLRTFLPPTVVFRNAADVDEDIPEPELNIPYEAGADGSVELVPSAKGITVKRKMKDGKEVEFIPIEDYYFGRQEGNKDYYEEKGDFRFKCAVCQRIFYSNVKLMSHILGHVDESSQAGLNVADSTQCQLCEAELATAFDLRAHMEQEHSGVYVENHSIQAPNATAEQFVPQTASQLLMQQRDTVPVSESLDSTDVRTGEHVATVGMLACRICGKEANSELALAHHLQSTHREREMPYVCRLCLFRSSLFEDILEHFKKEHDNSNHLLCTYCLRIFTPSDARAAPYPGMVAASGALGMPGLAGGIGQTQVYLQHLRMHQIRHQLRRCPTCKLNFTNKSDYQVHRRLDHRATRGTSLDKPQDTETGVVTIEEATDQAVQRLKETQPHITLMNAPEAGQLKSIAMLRIDDKVGDLACLECNQPLGTVDHKQYLPCSMCRFGTCCSMGYNRHMSRVHVYISGTHQVEPDTGMPLVRPVYFQWMADEVNAIEEFERQLLEQDTQQQSEPQSQLDGSHVPERLELGTERPSETRVSGSGASQHAISQLGEQEAQVQNKKQPSGSETPQNLKMQLLEQETKGQNKKAGEPGVSQAFERQLPEEGERQSETQAYESEVPQDFEMQLMEQETQQIDETQAKESEIPRGSLQLTDTETEKGEEETSVVDRTNMLPVEAGHSGVSSAMTTEPVGATRASPKAKGSEVYEEGRRNVNRIPEIMQGVETGLSRNPSMVCTSPAIDSDDADIADLLASGEELTAAEKIATESATGGNPSVCGPPVAEVTHAEKTLVWPAEEQSPNIRSDLRQLHVVMKYMASQLDARRFACTHCALSNLNGNSLARHLVEECGSNTVTLNPNPALVKARMEAEEQYRLQQEMQQHEQNETGILFEATDTTLSGADALCMPGHVAMTESQAQGDVIMVAVEPDQLASFGVMETTGADQAMVTNELVSQLGPTGTTIDVTNANGEVVQQFIIPDDLQLEEGQTLVVIHGEDGQPQLAIVNQADLIDPSGSRMMLQSEEDEANGMLLYTNAIGQPTQSMDGVVVQREEEKENHHYAI